MIKVTKCYGRKKPKEKSFITEFFDKSNTSDTNLICSKKGLQEDCLFSRDKENYQIQTLDMPALFQSFNFDNAELKKSSIDQKDINAKKKVHGKRNKGVQRKNNCKKNPKQIQHLSTKQCQLLQPCWPEILKHQFIVQKLENGEYRRSENVRTKLSRFAKTKTGLSENLNKRNVKEMHCNENKVNKSVKCLEFIPPDKNSEDLFLKPESIRVKRKKNTYGQENRRNESKTNETSNHLSSPELSINSSGGLFLSNQKRFLKKTCEEQSMPNSNPSKSLGSTDTKLRDNSDLIAPNSKKDDLVQDVSSDVQNVHNWKKLVARTNSSLCRENLQNISKDFKDAAPCMQSKTDNIEWNCNYILSDFQKSENFENLDFNSISKYEKCNHSKTRTGTKMKSNHSTYYDLITHDSFAVLENAIDDSIAEEIYFDLQSKDSCNLKKLNYDITKIVNTTPLVVKKSKFATSTPVMKTKSSSRFSVNFSQISLHSNGMHLSNKNHSMSNYWRQSSQDKRSTISGLSSKYVIERNSHLKSYSRSFTECHNKSFSSVNEPDELTKAKILHLCNQESVASFSDIYNWNNLKVKKIGEGTYGEVFLVTKVKLSYVLKVIPVSKEPHDCFQDFKSVLSEIQISKCLSELKRNKRNKTSNFTNLRRSLIVCGSYPSKLLDAWDDFKETKSCYNSKPDIFDDNQLFAILELDYGGKDMSCFVLRNALEAESILKQIAVSLAVAEEEHLFEHRDLHLGNILVERVKTKNISYKLQGKIISFPSHGICVTIIDFTLSRLYKDGYMYYYDLADDSLFEQSGDYQFDIYRSMKKHLQNQWEECSLYSNVLWLKYLCKKLMEFKYSRPSSAAHLKGLKAVEAFSSQLMSCKNAFETLTKCEITAIEFEKLNIHSSISKRSILVSRNSIQKSKVSTKNF